MKPSKIASLKEMAFSQSAQRNYDGAIQSFSHLLQYCPQDPFLYYNRALVQYEKSHYEDLAIHVKLKLQKTALDDAIHVIPFYIDNQIQTGLFLSGILISRLVHDLKLPESVFNHQQFYESIEKRKYPFLLVQIQTLKLELEKSVAE